MTTLSTTAEMFATGQAAPSEPTDAKPIAAEAWANEPIGGAQTVIESASDEVTPLEGQEQTTTDDGNARGEAGEPKPADGAPRISDALKAQAKMMGFADADIAAFASEQALTERMTQITSEILSASAGSQEQKPVQEQQQVKPEQAQQPQQQQGNPFRYDLKFENPDEWDQDTVKVLTGINDHYAQQTAKSVQILQAVAQKVMQQEAIMGQLMQETFMGKLSGWLGRNPAIAEAIGSDPAAHSEIINGMATVTPRLMKVGGNPDFDFVANLVANAKYGKQIAAAAAAKVHKDIQSAEKRLSGNVAGPGSGRKATAAPLPSRDQVIAEVREMMNNR